jgi:hypothetical protein
VSDDNSTTDGELPLAKITIKDCEPTEIRSALSVFERDNLAVTLILLVPGKENFFAFPLYFITNCKRSRANKKITTIAILSIGMLTPNSPLK